MRNNQSWYSVVKAAKGRKIFLQLCAVFAAFAVMTMAGYFFMQRVLWNRLIESSQRSLSWTEAYIHYAFAEADVSLLNTYHALRGQIESGASQQDLLKYLRSVTSWMRERKGMLRLYGVYGYIRGEFLDGINMNPGPDYIPQRSSWYQTAVRNIGSISYTTPYLDYRSGDMIISAVVNIDDAKGDIIGILAIDLNIDRLNEYVQALSLSEGGYGIILSRNMTVISHPKEKFEGRYIHEINKHYDQLSNILRSGKIISAMPIIDHDGEKMLTFFSPLFNGWYVGLLTPKRTFYRDIYYALAVLSVLALLLAFLLSLLLLRMEAARIRSDEESKSKSSFLARMSHEIRTPMNAIIGMGELALQAETLPSAVEYVKGIRQAGYNLLSLINDILDFSKIDAGNFEINSDPYELSVLLNNVINVARVRISEKPVIFIANIDPAIPNHLIGDDARIRQVLLNLLSNAAKYTNEGFIMLRVNASYNEAGRGGRGVLLSMEIADSGIGIKKEDIPKLFDNFVRLDHEHNRAVEGSGLGLSITRSLCRAMGGDVSVTSVYGQGSVFTVVIPQIAGSDIPLAAVEDPLLKAVLVYHEHKLYAESIFSTLQNLKIPVTLSLNAEDFLSKLENGSFHFAFASPNICGAAFSLIKEKKLEAQLLALTDFGNVLPVKGIPMIVMPAYAAPIAYILNGKEAETLLGKTDIHFIAPSAKLLIVDDIPMNLQVAEGLLAKYRAGICMCSSGEEALEMAKKDSYDIIFMDHMMPGMDGVEAAAAIRALEGNYFKQVPIIALTANAVSGMKEMFLSNGFSDYLSKPIEIVKLAEIMEKWIPHDKRESLDVPEFKANEKEPKPENPEIPFKIKGIDVERGIAMTGGTREGYMRVLPIFLKDAQMRLELLSEPPDNAELSFFISHFHAIKGASGSLGAAGISAQAAELEAAGKSGDEAAIENLLPEFTRHFKELIDEIRYALYGSAAQTQSQGGSDLVPMPLLTELCAALKEQKLGSVDRLLNELLERPLNLTAKELLERVSDEVLLAEFDKALEISEKLIEDITKAGR